jgi:hypothetical protein
MLLCQEPPLAGLPANRILPGCHATIFLNGRQEALPNLTIFVSIAPTSNQSIPGFRNLAFILGTNFVGMAKPAHGWPLNKCRIVIAFKHSLQRKAT